MNTKSKVLGLMVLGLAVMGDTFAMQGRGRTTREALSQAQTPASTLQKVVHEVATKQHVAEAFAQDKPTSAPPPSREESMLRGSASHPEFHLESSDRGGSGRGSDAMSREHKERDFYIGFSIVPLLRQLNNDVQFEHLNAWLNRWFEAHVEIKH